MNDQERRKRNWRVLLILGLLFVGLFTITTIGFVLGFEASPQVKKIVSVITTIIAGIFGVFLLVAVFIDIMSYMAKSEVRKRARK